MKSHLTIAREDGMKAGYNAYMTQLRAGRKLAPVAAILATYEGLSKRKAFAHYCATVGPDVLARPAIPTRITRTSKAVVASVAVPKGLASEVEQARARLVELEAELASKAAAPAQRKRTSKAAMVGVKENLWREWAVRKYGIPTTVGTVFAYKGKRRTTQFKVVRVTADGVFTVKA